MGVDYRIGPDRQTAWAVTVEKRQRSNQTIRKTSDGWNVEVLTLHRLRKGAEDDLKNIEASALALGWRNIQVEPLFCVPQIPLSERKLARIKAQLESCRCDKSCYLDGCGKRLDAIQKIVDDWDGSK